MKLNTINISGKEYPLIFSAWVIDQIQSKNDDVEAELNRILSSSKVSDMFWLLSLFLKAGHEASKLLGNEGPEPPTYEALMILTQVTEFGKIGEAIKAAVATSSPDIKLADDGKNRKTTKPTR